MFGMVGGTPGALSRRRFTDEELLDAALATFHAHGYHGAQMAEIAGRAGTTRPTLYARLGGKEQLYLRVVEREAERFTARLDDAYRQAAALPLPEMVGLAVTAFFDLARYEPSGFKILFRDETGGRALEIGRRAVDEVIDSIAELVTAAVVRAGRTPGRSVQMLASATAGAAIQVCLHSVDHGRDLDLAEALAARYIEAAMRRLDPRVLAEIDGS
jgi:AcrR family transcriptional regulator